METCRFHPDRPAATTCARCEAPICEECIAPGTDPPLCMDCSIAAEGEKLERELPPPAAGPPSPAPRQPAIGRGGKAMLVLGLLIILAEVGIILLMRPTPAPAAAGDTGVSAKQQVTAQAAADLIILQSALETYKKEHGRYPDSLEEIAGQLPEPLRSSLRANAIVYSLENNQNYRLRYASGSPQPLVLEHSRQAIVVEEVTP